MDGPFGGVHKLRLQDLAFFDDLPPSVYFFYGIKIYKKSIFLTPYPPPLVNVVCERPLRRNLHTIDISRITYLPRFVNVVCECPLGRVVWCLESIRQ